MNTSACRTIFRRPSVGLVNRRIVFQDANLAGRARNHATRTIATYNRTIHSGNGISNNNNSTSTRSMHSTTTQLQCVRETSFVPRSSPQRRSMVTITKTKSADVVAPLYSSSEDAPSSPPAAVTYAINEDASLIVTESCLNQVERLLRQRRERENRSPDEEDGYFLRVFVDAGGCSGFQYQFEVDHELDEDEDIVVVRETARLSPRVVVDENSLEFLKGSTVDYVIEMIKSAFVVSDNPQSESACGCGSSFAMKNFEKFGAKD